MMHGLPLCLPMRVELAALIVTGHTCTGRTVAHSRAAGAAPNGHLDLRLSECSITAMDCILMYTGAGLKWLGLTDNSLTIFSAFQHKSSVCQPTMVRSR